MSRRAPHRFTTEPARGFTLIEIMIALVIVALLAGITVPVYDNVTRAELRSAASHLSGMVKATYDTAVLEGRPCRLVFDIEKRTVAPEISADAVTLNLSEDSRPRSAFEKHEEKPSENDEANDLLAIAKRQNNFSSDAQKAPSFTAIPGARPYTLEGQVRVVELSAEHLSGGAKEGKPALYFFPMGYSEHALIHLEDDAGRVFSVEVEPLTGRTKIIDKRVDYRDEP